MSKPELTDVTIKAAEEAAKAQLRRTRYIRITHLDTDQQDIVSIVMRANIGDTITYEVSDEVEML